MELNKRSVETWLNLIREFLKSFRWLGDSFVLDHFTNSHWQELPECWREFLTLLGPAELSQWILTGKYVLPKTSSATATTSQPRKYHPTPLSLQAFRQTVEVLSLDRAYSNCHASINQDCPNTVQGENHVTDGNKINSSINVGSIVIEDKLLKLLNRHVKPKKQHEIRHLSALIQELSHRSGNLKNVIDIGSGLGHLCRFLSYGLGFNTIGIDSDSQLGLNAKIFNQEIEKHLQRRKEQNQNDAANKRLVNDCDSFECDQPQDCIPSNSKLKSRSDHLNKFLKIDDKISLFEEFGLVGLHGCGDLGGIIVQNFVHNPQVKFLAFASCCYMKLNQCFPLSSFLQDNPIELKYESLELACHAKEIYIERLNDPDQVNKLKTHCYRAALETILRDRGFVREGLRAVKNSHLLQFPDYAIKATKNLEVSLTDQDLHSDSIETMLNEWMQVVYFYTLRVLIAPVIETVVLLDRALLILEHGFRCELRPLFDPVKSPRNIVIVGIKPTD